MISLWFRCDFIWNKRQLGKPRFTNKSREKHLAPVSNCDNTEDSRRSKFVNVAFAIALCLHVLSWGYGTTHSGYGTTPVGCRGGSRNVEGRRGFPFQIFKFPIFKVPLSNFSNFKGSTFHLCIFKFSIFTLPNCHSLFFNFQNYQISNFQITKFQNVRYTHLPTFSEF